MKHNLFRSAAVVAAVVLGSIGFEAQATWVYANGSLTNEENGYVLSTVQLTLTDGDGNNVTGLRVHQIVTQGSGDIDFTGFVTEKGLRVISTTITWSSAPELRRFIAPDALEVGPWAAFKDAPLLEEISFPKVVTLAGAAFQGCTNLKCAVELPAVKTIDKWAFKGSAITSFSAPKLEKVNETLLGECSELTTVVVGPLCATNFASGCYANCPKLASITPAPIITSENCTSPFNEKNTAYFSANPLLIKGDGVKKIPNSYLKNVPELKWIEVACNNIETVEAWAFQGIAADAEIRWEGLMPTTFSDVAFYGDVKTALKRKRLIVLGDEKNIASWKASTYFKELTEDDKTGTFSADYLEAKKFGRVVGTLTYMWLIDGRQGLCIRIQ